MKWHDPHVVGRMCEGRDHVWLDGSEAVGTICDGEDVMWQGACVMGRM